MSLDDISRRRQSSGVVGVRRDCNRAYRLSPVFRARRLAVGRVGKERAFSRIQGVREYARAPLP